MATTAEYLTQLKKDKKNLVNNLVAKGVSASDSETFTSLVPKVNDVKAKLQDKIVNPLEEGREVISDDNYDGLNKVTINPIKASMIEGLKASNIKKNVEILDIVGTYGATSQIKYATPSQEEQIIKPDSGIEFLSQVTIQPVTSGIDEDIVPTNIKKGVNILGVEGTFDGDLNFQTKTVSANANDDLVVTPDYGYDALDSITVKKVTSNIDSNIKSENIKNGIEILGVEGTYAPDPSMENKYIYPATYEKEIYPDEGYSYFDKVTIAPVTSSIDSNIKTTNIKKGVNILGVEGTLEEVNGEEIFVTPTKEEQVIIPDLEAGKNAITKATINPVTSAVDENIVNTNIKKGISILGVEGSFEGASALQDKTVTPTSEEQYVTADSEYDALSSVTIEAVSTEDITVDPYMSTKTYVRSDGKFINSVTVNQVTSDVDANIQPENIKQNMSILGVVGTYTGTQQNYFSALNNTGDTDVAGIVKSIIAVPENVVITVGKYQFFGCTGLTSVPKLDYSNLTDCTWMFYNCTNITDISNFVNLNKITNANAIFGNCSKITSADLTTWNGTNITNYLGLFSSCSKLVNVDLSGLVSPNGTTTQSMFNGCSVLKSITANNTQITINSSCSYMFSNCKALVTLDLSWLVSTVKVDCLYMFSHCDNLQFLDIRNLALNLVTSRNGMFNYVPTTCEIIVGTDADKTWMTTNFPDYTNVKTVAELEV